MLRSHVQSLIFLASLAYSFTVNDQKLSLFGRDVFLLALLTIKSRHAAAKWHNLNRQLTYQFFEFESDLRVLVDFPVFSTVQTS